MVDRLSPWRPLVALVALVPLTLSGCGSAEDPPTSGAPASGAAVPAAPPQSGSAPPTAAPTTPAADDPAWSAPGLKVGEIPAVPEIVVPDVSVVTNSASAFIVDVTRDIAAIPGVTVAPARCDGQGVVLPTGTVLGGDGSAVASGADGSVVVGGDGSGVVALPDGTNIVNGGDGSAVYSSPDLNIVLGGDGSATYASDVLSVVIGGDGSGTWANSVSTERIVLPGDGSGTHSVDGGFSTVNAGDGTGTYSDDRLSIVNDGKGSALVTLASGESRTVPADPVPAAPSVGSAPSVDALAPVESCGTTITLRDGVLFDFGRSEVRADAAEVLAAVAGVLQQVGAPLVEVHGHTDSVSDEAFNQGLSEDRAEAVARALQDHGVGAAIESTGFGESRPVAPNEHADGSDNPAGRQLNRRVEIFVPAF